MSKKQTTLKYVADDGTVFDSRAACEDYENPPPQPEIEPIVVYGQPAPISDEILLRHTPEARLRRMLDDLSVKVCNAAYSADDVVKFMGTHRIEHVRMPVGLSDELAKWQAALESLRAKIGKAE